MARRWVARLCVAAGLLALAGCEIDATVSEDETPVSGATVFELFTPAVEPENAFDVVFVPDGSYGDMSVLANRQTFADDAADAIENGYWQNQAYFSALFSLNYFYMTVSGSVTPRPPDADGNFRCPTVTWPAQVNTDAAFADQIILLHSNDLRDCGGGGRATAEPTSYRTIVHETGHVIFGLPDEYCCDGGYFVAPPVMYSSQSACTGDSANASWRDCRSHTSSRDGSVWWRSQGDITTNLIMFNVGTEVWESGPADWASMSNTYGSAGNTVGAPTVFAPERWSYAVPPAP